MSWFLVVEIIVIIFFLVMFYRQPNLTWAVGLLTVATAVLLSVIVSIFRLEDALSETGLWQQVVRGLVVGGAAFWLMSLLWPQLSSGLSAAQEVADPSRVRLQAAVEPDSEQLLSRRAVGMRNEGSEYDRQLLFDQIMQNLSLEDVLDLIFDVEMAENEVVSPTRDMQQTVYNIIDLAQEREQMGDLALAVERILTPVPPDHFPRLSRITTESPPTILRRYLLTFYSLEELEEMSNELEIDWERLGIGSKQQKVRNLLLWIKRRNR
ncbi:MAG: hypothetical protein AAGD96_21670, partial [Chloroflexota bacterium]